MVVSKYSIDDYMPSKIVTGALIQNPEMLKFFPDRLKTKKMGKHAVKILPFVIRYIPN